MSLLNRIPRALAAICLLASVLTASASKAEAASADGNDWYSWRGPENIGVSRATGLPDSWTEGDGKILWKADVPGRSTPIIMNGRVYAIHLIGRGPTWKEEVVCLRESDGKILWRYAFDLFQTDVPADRVGWTSLVGDPETGYVYAHGVQGLFFCFDKRGHVIWKRSLTEEYGRISGYGGRTHTPMIDGDNVIVSFLSSGLGAHGPGRHRYLAMDKRTGEVIYWAAPGENPLDTTFSVPAVAVINGVRQLIGGNGDGWIYGMKAATGEKIWGFKLSKRGINSSVVVQGNKVYAMHSEDNVDARTMGRIVCIDATGQGDVTRTHEIWRKEEFRAGYASPVLVDGRLYALDNSGNLVCLNADTGQEFWSVKVGKISWGSPVWADGKIYVPEVDGKFHIVRAGDTSAEILSTIEFKDPEIPLVDIRGCPAIANGRLFLMTREGLYCVGEKDPKLTDIEAPVLPDVGTADPTPAYVQVVPAEVHVEPGEKTAFEARLYDANGRLIGEARDVDWAVKGLQGGLKKNKFTPALEPNGQFGLVTATINTPGGPLAGEARVRVNAELPYQQDFEALPEGEGGPGFWIGASKVKFKVLQEEGNKILRKDADDERFLRADVYIGPWTMSNYTVQADIRAHEKRRRLPDMGVINTRYQIDLRGNTEEMRVVSWIPMPRVLKTVPFVTELGVWYRIKSRVDYTDSGAIVRGKVWKRDEAEPAAWTIELEDPAPPKSGSPGLACFALGEVDYDNVSITPSEPLAAE